MKTKAEPIKVTYPFSGEIAYTCRCGKTLRHSNMHNRIYIVSALDHDEIRTTVPHKCVKDKRK